jgi:tripartite-type tricarboxylate transporter receptor subunit TctC
VDMFMDKLPSILPHIRSGSIRALVVTSDSRAPELPDVPSLPEAGVQGMAVESWFGILAPARTPASVLDSLNAAFARALRGEGLRQRLRELGATPMGGSREAMRLHMAAELERWSGVVRQAGLRAE